MKRQAIIIANPGKSGTESYLGGVTKDVENFRSFLLSPNGGLWREDEIIEMVRPSRTKVLKAIDEIIDCEYAFVAFSGHGWYSSFVDSTILELRDGEDIDSNDLRTVAPKQTLIIDCCRVVESAMPSFIMDSARIAKRAAQINPKSCRKYYNSRIEECAAGIVVMHSCAIGETSGDDARKGGYYTSNLLETSKDWARNSTTDTSENYSILSVDRAHDAAMSLVERYSGRRQNPYIEKPRTPKQFPFCIVA